MRGQIYAPEQHQVQYFRRDPDRRLMNNVLQRRRWIGTYLPHVIHVTVTDNSHLEFALALYPDHMIETYIQTGDVQVLLELAEISTGSI